MTSAIVLAVLAAQVRLEPATLTFGPQPTAAVEVVAPEGTASMKLVGANGIGAFGPFDAAGGKFKTSFTFPVVRAPQVALLALELTDKAGAKTRAFASLPLFASANLKVETKANTAVTVTIGDFTFGPANADGKGRLSLGATVPPGYPSATVKATDRAGNVTTQPLPLTGIPFSQALVLVPERATPDKAVEVEVFAVDGRGKPLADPSTLAVKPARGSVGAAESKGGGVFVLQYTAPKIIAGGPDEVTAAVEKSAMASAKLKLEPGAPVRVDLEPATAEFVAGSGTAISVKATVVDANGNPHPDVPVELSSDLGSLEGGQTLTLPDVFLGKKEARLTAKAGATTGEVVVKLKAAAPKTADLTLQGTPVAGEPIDAELVVRDAFGNPVDAADGALSVVGGGQQASLRQSANGGYRVDLVPDKGASPGSYPLNVQAGGATLVTKDVSLLGWQRPWAVVLGATVGGNWNFQQARAFDVRLSAGLRLGRTPVEVVAEGGYGLYPKLEKAPTTDNGNDATIELNAWTVALVARAHIPVTARLGILLSAAGGAQNTTAKISAPNVAEFTQSQWGVLLRGGGGLSIYAGIGRVIAQVEYGWSPGTGSVQGNLSGLHFGLGYIASF